MPIQTQEEHEDTPQQNLFENLTQQSPVQIRLKIHQLENSYGQRKPPNVENIRDEVDNSYTWVSQKLTEMTPELLEKQEDGTSQRISLTEKGEETVRLLRQLQETLDRGEQR